MHLFIIEHYTNLDSLAPVIHKLSSNNEKVFVFGTHPFKHFKDEKLVKFLLNSNKNIHYENYLPLGIKEKLLIFIINLISLMPKKFICGKSFWLKISRKILLINENKILEFIKKKKIASISFEDSILKKKQILIKKISVKAKIPLIIIYPSSYGHIYNKKVSNTFSLDLADFNLISNNLSNASFSNNKKNFFFGMARYNLEWLKILDKIYNKIESDDNMIKIAAFSNNKQKNYKKFKQIIDNLKTLNYIQVIERNKPKDNLPKKCSKFQNDKYSTTQIINWCDLIFFNMNSSVFVEALIKNKTIVYLKSLDDFDDRTIDDNYLNIKNIFYKLDDYNQLLNFIELIKKNPQKKNNIKNYSEAIEEMSSYNYKNLYKFLEFYKNINAIK